MSNIKVLYFWKKRKGQPSLSEQLSLDPISLKKETISGNLQSTMEIFNSFYSIPINSDVKVRNLLIGGLNKKASIIYISTITDSQVIENQVIKNLLLNSDDSKEVQDILSTKTIKNVEIIGDILKEINKGNVVILVDGHSMAYIIDASKFQGRSIEKAENEVSLKGPKEAFNEQAVANISLIRKKIKNESLIVEITPVSVRANNELYILYMKDLVNDELLQSVKERVNSLDVASIQNLSLLEQFIEDREKSIFPTILNTEKPDRAVAYLEDGFIILLMDNSPTSLVLPATFWSFFHLSEDNYLRILFANFIRSLRILALFITLFASATYISITNYHVEMIPTDLLLAISATREIVPFPSVIEILLMEIAFELIREAGLRVPSPIGPTIGIVGALILGQAAVQANIVSPLVVIIVALGGLSSFVIGDINMNFTIRLLRFLFIISGALFGFYGMAAVFTVILFYMLSIKTFGVPYLSPMTPKYVSSKDTVFRKLLQNQIFRPGYLKPKDMDKKAGE